MMGLTVRTLLRRSALVAAIAALLGLANAVQAETYRLEVIGTLGGSSNTICHANNAGQAAGRARTTPGVEHAYLYSGGVIHDLGVLPGFVRSDGCGLNDLGEVVGSSSSTIYGEPPIRAFVYIGVPGIDGRMVALPPLPGYTSSEAQGINNAGDVVGASLDGWSGNVPNGVPCLWRRLAGGTYAAPVELPPLVTGGRGYAWDINETGQVSGQSTAADGRLHATMWGLDETGTMVVRDLGTLGGGAAYGMSINSNGQVVGSSELPNSNPGEYHAFVWSGGTTTDLVPLHTGYATAQCINDAGQIVGVTHGSAMRGYLYDQGIVTDFASIVPAGHGVTTFYPYKITNAGVISGNGLIGGVARGFLLIPVRAPVAYDQAAATYEDCSTTISLAASDPGSGALTYTVIQPPAHGALSGTPPDVTYTPSPNYHGTDSFLWRASSSAGESNTAAVTITVNPVNDAPVAVADTASTDEDQAVTINVLANDSDADGDTLSILDITQGVRGTVGVEGGAIAYTPLEDANGTDTFSYTVGDGAGGSATATVTVSISLANDAPVVGDVTGPATPVAVGGTVTLMAEFVDPDLADTPPDAHTVAWHWGDGTSSTAAVAGTPVIGEHAYTTPGVYTVTVQVTDREGLSSEGSYCYVVVYDPDGGFVTGGGWIVSPTGAYVADPALTGKATFGFNAKYKTGADIPTGQAEFQFRLAGLSFHSSSYEWLVVAGARAQFKGVGTINGAGSYRFFITAVDGQIAGGDGSDRFRIRIWGDAGLVYDNDLGAPDGADPTTQLGGGSIVIHAK